MGTPRATRGDEVTGEVSPEMLEPLVTVVATLGDLGATAGDVPLAKPPGSLRAGLVALVATIKRALGHPHGEATRLRRALGATTGATRATTGATWTTVDTMEDTRATIAREWREAVASLEATWATLAGDVTALKEACEAVANSVATSEVPEGHLEAMKAQEAKTCQDLLEATKVLPVVTKVLPGVPSVATEAVTEVVTEVASELATHDSRVAEATMRYLRDTEATEKTMVAMEESAVAKERGRRAMEAQGPLGRLVAACHGATRFYQHLRRLLEDIEATVAGGRGGPEEKQGGGPGAPEVAQEVPGGPKVEPGGPEDLLAAVAVAGMLWDASSRLAQGHLLGALRVAQRLLCNPGVPNASVAASVAQRCRDATSAIPGLLVRGHQ